METLHRVHKVRVVQRLAELSVPHNEVLNNTISKKELSTLKDPLCLGILGPLLEENPSMAKGSIHSISNYRNETFHQP